MQNGGNAWDAKSFGGKFGKKGELNRDEYFEKDDEGYFKLKDGYEQRSLGESTSDSDAEMVYSNDYDDLESPEDARYFGIFKKGQSSDSTPSPETPANDPQELLESYKQGITANNSTEVEKVGSNLNTDLINNMETTDNNQFGSKTFSAVPIANKAAQNFLTDKKQLVLNAFR